MTDLDLHRPWYSTGSLSVLGTGYALPGPPISTEALLAMMAARFGLSSVDQARAVSQRLMIDSRHLSRPWNQAVEPPDEGCSNPDLAARAVMQALDAAGVQVHDVGYLIGHTATPLQPLPSNIAHVADRIGYRGPHLELRQACTGFANAVMIAFGLLQQPGARPVVIVGSETGSAFFDPRRPNEDFGQLVNMVQMGDGAGAIVLAPESSGPRRLHTAFYGALGYGREPGLQMHTGAQEFDHHYADVKASGGMLFEAAFKAACVDAHVPHEVDYIIPHQVSGRIGPQIATHLNIAAERFFGNARVVGNTGSAAIWLAFAQLYEQGIRPDQRVLILGAEATKYMYGGFLYDHG